MYFSGLSERLEAHFQKGDYNFFVTDRKPEVFTISMYHFPYKLIKSDGKWWNHPGNRMEMTGGLVVAIPIDEAVN